VIFAKLRGYPNVVMETDCLEIINLWNTRHGSRSAVAPILQEIGELVSSFYSFLIQHVVRPANYRTHSPLCKACLHSGDDEQLARLYPRFSGRQFLWISLFFIYILCFLFVFLKGENLCFLFVNSTE
jgi:hypothetical protein